MGDFFVRATAVEALGHIGKKGDHRILDIVGRSFTDVAVDVRRAAATAMTRLADDGDQQAIIAVSTRLKFWIGNIKLIAVDALVQLAKCRMEDIVEEVPEPKQKM